MTILPEIYEPILATIEKPGRYVGGELNAINKDPDSVRASIALAFPDVYDIGMSYHGFRLLYESINADCRFAAERVYTPWPDFADAIRAAGLPLTTLESYRPLGKMDIIGFTLQHELNFTNVLEMIDLAGIPLHACNRNESHPLVIAGGEGAYSPEPMAEFIDAFVLGDGEEVILEILEAVAHAKDSQISRTELLRYLAGITGVYIPAFYQVSYNPDGTVQSIAPNEPIAPRMIRPRVFDISKSPGSVRPVVPLIRTVQDRTVVEVRRGCVNGCRFCQAGMITRPVRERPVDQIARIIEESISNTGDNGVTLLSLSTADYTQLRPLMQHLNKDLKDRKISISLPSLRISSFDVSLASELSSVRKSGFTFAPEAGSECLRRRINKPLDEDAFLDAIEQAFRAGWRCIKMYFMLGLPGETDEDLDGIPSIVHQAQDRAHKIGMRNVQINLTLSPFSPKAHTPFQWEAQASLDELRRRMAYVREKLPRRNVACKTSPLESSFLEAALSRGDRRLGAVIERAWRAGCRFDGWREKFNPNAWWNAFAECGLDPAWYANRERGHEEIFPYEHIASGPGKNFLALQRDMAMQDRTTPDCVNHPCAHCDACARPRQHVLASSFGKQSNASSAIEETPITQTHTDSHRGSSSEIHPSDPPAMRARLRFTKSGSLRFIGHLDLAEMIHRLLRLAGAPLAHSQGYNPQPHIALSPPLSLGFEGLGELADLFLTQKTDLSALLRLLNGRQVQGLVWTAAKEIPLKAPSLQQSIQHFSYRISWHRNGLAAPCLPLGQEQLRQSLIEFMNCATWPVEVQRKDKLQHRDARQFVIDCGIIDPPPGDTASLQIKIRSDNGVTLNPILILKSLFTGEPGTGVILRVVRLPLKPT